MESMTKFNQPDYVIKEMAKRAFAGVEVTEIKELNEGFFNVAYELKLSDRNEVILKIAPPPNVLIMTNEKNIMYSEVKSMGMVSEMIDVPIAQILYYDNNHDLCDSDFFFMKKLLGNSLNSLMEKLSEDIKENINYETGVYTAKINSITGKKFGYFGQEDKQGTNWYQVFVSMITDAVKDADYLNIDLKQPVSLIYELLERDRHFFNEVTIPKLVHWDLWAGNVFVNDGKISGLIDFERCMWADELMEVGFRAFCYNENFYRGYGIEQLTDSQIVRKEWYDIYFSLIVCLECDYRHYETRDMYHWGTSLLADFIKKRNTENIK